MLKMNNMDARDDGDDDEELMSIEKEMVTRRTSNLRLLLKKLVASMMKVKVMRVKMKIDALTATGEAGKMQPPLLQRLLMHSYEQLE